MTAPMTLEASKVDLQLPCECTGGEGHTAGGCPHPAQWWVIVHDLADDCRKTPDGTVSLYVCDPCWKEFTAEIDRMIRRTATGFVLVCQTCDLEIRRRADVVHRVTALTGLTR